MAASRGPGLPALPRSEVEYRTHHRAVLHDILGEAAIAVVDAKRSVTGNRGAMAGNRSAA